jgi:hypothetical protein
MFWEHTVHNLHENGYNGVSQTVVSGLPLVRDSPQAGQEEKIIAKIVSGTELVKNTLILCWLTFNRK